MAVCFIGGVAVQRWGEPRLTQDVDLTILAGFGSEEEYVDALLARFVARRPDARNFAVQYRVLLIQTKQGIAIDAAMGALPFEERCIGRATPWMFHHQQIPLLTCSAEDLVIHKVFAGQDRDWADVEGILARQHSSLDFNLIRSELQPLLELKGAESSLERLEAVSVKVKKRLAD